MSTKQQLQAMDLLSALSRGSSLISGRCDRGSPKSRNQEVSIGSLKGYKAGHTEQRTNRRFEHLPMFRKSKGKFAGVRCK